MRRSQMMYVESKYMRSDVTDFRTGDTVRVHWKVREGEKERVQTFEGIVIRKTKGQNRATFTVRKMSFGVGVERIFPLHSPRYERIEVVSRGNVNRNRLFYLRNLRGKASRIQTMEESETHAAKAAARATAQAFEGVVIRKTRGGTDASFTVRKMSFGVGVERIFPLHSPRYEQIEVLSRGDVNRNRLFYLRDLKGKASRVETQEENAPASTEGKKAAPAAKPA